MQTANAAVINAFTPGSIDYSNWADQWDGSEQAMIPKEFQNKPSNGTFMYKMNVMGWSMHGVEFASWKNAVNKKIGNGLFNVPQKKLQDTIMEVWRIREELGLLPLHNMD